MTGPAVDVEQLAPCQFCNGDIGQAGSGHRSWCPIFRTQDLPEPTEQHLQVVQEIFDRNLGPFEFEYAIAHVITDAVAAERAKHTDLIRRQDAALTAVRELADALDIDAASEAMEAESDELDPHQMERQMGRSEATQSAADALRAALASPDTTQEADRG